jgi:hypothetical protein
MAFRFLEDLLDPTDGTILQAHLDTVGMSRGFCENVQNCPFRQFAGTLILFLYNLHMCARFDIRAVVSIHAHILTVSLSLPAENCTYLSIPLPMLNKYSLFIDVEKGSHFDFVAAFDR